MEGIIENPTIYGAHSRRKAVLDKYVGDDNIRAMFLASTSRLYARETTEEEFIRYVRDNGVSTALQPALSLLYKLPIKPNNIKEFFAEYLENGACTLTKLSLLRAELCYLQAEEQDLQLRLKNLDRDLVNISDTLTAKQSSFSLIGKDESQFSDLMSRFVEDTKNNPSIRYDPFDLSTPDFQAEATKERDIEAKIEKSEIAAKPVDCIPSKDSLLDMIEDIKEFDPWGMIFKYYDSDLKFEFQRLNPKENGNTKDKKTMLPCDERQTYNSERNKNEKGDKTAAESCDSEDADTLVELFHAKIIPDTEIDESFIEKQKSEKVKFSELMGWDNSQGTGFNFSPKYPTNSEPSNTTWQQNYKERAVNQSASGKRNKNMNNLLKFYSHMNSDVAADDFFNSIYENSTLRNSISKEVQTSVLDEFEELEGEDWEWEWESEEGYAYPENLQNKRSIPSDSDYTAEPLGNITLVEEQTQIDSSANEPEIIDPNADRKPSVKKQKQLENFQVPQANGTFKLLAMDPTLKQCDSQNDIPKKGKNNQRPMGAKFNDVNVTDKKAVKGNNYRIRSFSGPSNPKAVYSSGNKSTKILKYIYETYDTDMASKLQHQFDFRIFDD